MKKIFFTFVLLIIIDVEISAQTIFGIDVNDFNGTINWSQVKTAGKEFAFVRATSGATYTDIKFQTNILNGANAGIAMGAYHFAEPGDGPAMAQAQYFLSVADTFIGPGFLPPVLDIEADGGLSYSDLSDWIQEWLTEVQQQTGVIPVLYTSAYFASNLDSSLNIYNLWIGSWDGNPTPPTNLGVWTDWSFKQYSGTGSVTGISGSVDLDIFNGDSTALNNLLGNVTGIKQKHLKDLAMNIYPNPTNSLINISIEENINDLTIDLYNINGQVVYSDKISGNNDPHKSVLDARKFKQGIYFLRCVSENRVEVKKIIIN